LLIEFLIHYTIYSFHQLCRVAACGNSGLSSRGISSQSSLYLPRCFIETMLQPRGKLGTGFWTSQLSH